MKNVEDIYPLSPMQRGMLFHTLLDPEDGAYVTQNRFELLGKLDGKSFQGAWKYLLERHPILRTGFLSEGLDQPMQVVRRKVKLPLSFEDWREVPEEEWNQRFEKYQREDFRRGFDVRKAPLVRMAVFRLEKERYLCLWTMHHILMDGWCLGILFREFLVVYEALRQGVRPRLPSPRPFRDYISWLEEQDPTEAETFWREYLQGFEQATPLPAVRPGSEVPEDLGDDDGEEDEAEDLGGFAGHSTHLSEASTDRLKAFARGQALTLATLVQQAWGLLLTRYAQTEDVVFGAVVSGRPPELEGVEETVGLFVNTLPVRVGVAPQRPVVESLRELQSQQLEMRRFEHTLLTDLQRWSGMGPGQALFHHLLAYENYPEIQGEDDGAEEASLTVRGLDSSSKTNYPLTLGAFPGESLDLRLEYYTSHYDATTASRLGRHLVSLLEGLAVDGGQRPLAALSLLAPPERQQLLVEWNDRAVKYPGEEGLAALFAETARQRPEAVLLSAGAQHTSRRVAEEQANRLAHHLLALDEVSLGRGSRVGLFLDRSPELVIAVLAVLKVGGAYVPLATDYPEERLRFMIEDAGLTLVLTESSHAETVASLPLPWVDLNREAGAIAGRPQIAPPPVASGSDLAYVIYTSGSTGRPKGVAVPQRAVTRLVWDVDYMALHPEASALLLAPVSFDASTLELWAPLLVGGRLVVMPPGPPTLDRLEHVLGRERISILWLTAGLFHLVADERPDMLADVGRVLAGGDAISAPRARRVNERVGTFCNMYGPTENTTFSTGYAVRDAASEGTSIPIGRPIPNSTAFVADPRFRVTPLGSAGELLTGGEGLAWGYLGRPALTAERFVPDPFSGEFGARLYRTGDLVRSRTDGTIDFIGRFDNQVKIRGFRIEPGEVEATVLQHPAVGAGVVVVREDGGEKRLVAYVVGKEGEALDVDGLRRDLEQHLPGYMMPADFMVLDKIPLTPNGKVDRAAIPAPGLAVVRRGKSTPRTPTEGLLAGLWQEVLGVEGVGPEDDFFALGGHSLSAIQVTSRIKETFGVEIALRELFEGPTLAELASSLDRTRDQAKGRERPPVAARGLDWGEPAPLSFPQQRLWFLDRLEPGTAAYNLPLPLEVKGPLDPARVAACLGVVERRHDSLRTRFLMVEGQPAQVVDPPGALRALPVVDLSGLPEAVREHEVLHLATADALRPFDLETGPLMRATLVHRGPGLWAVLFNMHHIISDGWSLEVLVNEVSQLYAAHGSGQPARLPQLPIQYTDYAAWQREWLVGEVLEGEMGYWREQLATAPRVLELPWDHPRTEAESPDAATCSTLVSTTLVNGLRDLARGRRVTLFMTTLAAFGVLLGRTGAQRGVALGTPVTGRNQLETEPLIGFFVNTLVLYLDLAPLTTLREVLDRARDVVLEAHTHQGVPFERLVEELHPDREAEHSPLFQVMFSLQNRDTTTLELPDLELAPLTVERGVAKFDLTLEILEEDDFLDVTFEYRRGLFDATTIERMLRQYLATLEALVEDPERPFRELSLLSRPQRQQVLVEWSGGAELAPAELLPARFATYAAQEGDRIALTFADKTLTYAEVEAQATALAHRLRALGIGTESRVAVLAPRSVQRVVSSLGVWKVGAATVPLDPEYPVERLAFCLDDASPCLLLLEGTAPEGLDLPAELQVLELSELETSEMPEAELSPGPASGDLAYLIYTSGTTGRPKAVAVEHGQLAHTLAGTSRRFGLSRGDAWLSVSSYAFDISLFEVWAPLLSGGQVRLVRGEELLDMPRLAAALEGITHLHTVPSLLRQVVEYLATDPAPAASLQQIFVGGDAVPPSLLERIAEVLSEVRTEVLYGPTEATILATHHPVPAGGVVGNPIGRPLPEVTVQVVDRRGLPVPPGIAGELWLGGGGVARGYLGRPGLTAERFVPRDGGRFYRTGDRVRFRADSVLEFLGRTDRQVKVRGFRIEPGEVAVALEDRGDVTVAVVVARRAPGGEGEKQLVAYVVCPEGVQAPSPEVLAADLESRLPAYMVPSAFVPLDALPLSPTGKVDLAALPAPEVSTGEFIAPRNATEAVLADVWAEVLERDAVGVEDNFFQLGGHSLLATQVMSRLRQTLGLEVPLRALFEEPTVAGLAREVQALERESAGSARPPLVPLARDGKEVLLPLSFAQQRLWFIDRLNPESSLYNMPFPVRLEGVLEVDVLGGALSRMVTRHEVLRTVFVEVEEEPRQQVLPAQAFPLPRVDLRGLSEDRRRDEGLRLVALDAERAFDLVKGPVLRATLVEMAPEENLLLFNLHHIAGDGWSIELLVQEVAALYGAGLEGRAARLPALPVQYGEYASWQRSWLHGDVLEAELAHWRERLAEVPAVLELPTDRARPTAPSFRGATRERDLPAPVAQALRRLAGEHKTTAFVVYLSGLAVLLSRLADQRDLALGTVVAGRNQLEIEPLVGFFVNTLVLRARVGEEQGFTHLLDHLRDVVLDAQGHQEVPFERLVEELAPQRDLGHTPLFQVMFTHQDEQGDETPSLEGLRMELVQGEGTQAKFDLGVMVVDQADGGASLSMEYALDLFDGTTVERWLRDLEKLFTAVAEAPKHALAELPRLDAVQRHQMVVEWNDTAVEIPSEAGLSQLFVEQATRRSETVALVAGAEHMTYGLLDRRSRRLAAALVREGVQPDQGVGLFAERSFETLVAVLGILAAGGAYVPLDPAYPEERLQLMMEDAGVDLVLVSQAVEGTPPEGSARTLVLEALAASGEVLDEPVAAGGDSLAYVFYTSGSTGRPKGVAIPQRGVVRLVRGTNYARYHEEVAYLSLAPLAFDATTLEFWVPLLAGGNMVLLPPGTPSLEVLGSAFRRHRVSMVWLTAGLFDVLAEERPDDLQDLELLMTGGDVISPELVRKIVSVPGGANLMNGYGPTENTTFTTTHPLPSGAPVPVPVPIGRPVSNSAVWIVDRGLRLQPLGVFGELATSGLGLARGYHRRPGFTAERFVPHPAASQPGDRVYRTGDRARYLADGRLDFGGRFDFQVKIRGFRVEPGEVEAALTALPEVAAATVLVREDGGEKRLVAYVVGRDGKPPEVPTLQQHLTEDLPPYLMPAAIVPLQAFPLTPNGKLDRAALPVPGFKGEKEFVAPRTATEQSIAEIWSRVLEVDRVGAEDSFFELGGHSLLATRVVSRLREAFGVEVPLRALFEAPTVRGLAGEVEQARRRASGLEIPPLEKAPREGDLPLSFAQQRLWFIDRLEPGLPLYNMPFPVRLEGPLDAAALEHALDSLVARHEVLRTTFVEVEGQPVQRIAEPSRRPLPRIDLSALTEPVSQGEVERLVLLDALRPFDLAGGPVLRYALLLLAPEDAALLFNLHHIAGDGWSIEVLTQEVASIYRSVVEEEPVQLPELSVQYADFATWQRGWLSGDVLEREVRWWRERLEGAPSLLDLPLDRPRPSAPSFRGASRTRAVSATAGEALRELARGHGATVFMVTLAGVAALLGRTSGQGEVSLGTPIAGRTRGELEGLIGFFVNTLVLRIHLGDDPTFKQLLGRVREVSLEAQVHQDVPFERLVEELAPDRNLGHSPLFQVMFTQQNRGATGERQEDLSGVRMTPMAEEGEQAKFDLHWMAVDAEDGTLGLAAVYALDLFDSTTIERWLRRLGTLFEKVALDPETRLSALTPMPASERHQVALEWNDTATSAPLESGLSRLFAEQVGRRSDAVAAVDGVRQLSYGELEQRALRVAALLVGKGVRPGQGVGLFTERSLEMVAAVLGIVAAGGAYVPLDPEYPAERLQWMLADAGIDLVLVSGKVGGEVPEGAHVLDLQTACATGEPLEEAVDVAGDALAYIFYTSGSTGLPKGVATPHRAVVRLVKEANFAQFDEDLTFLGMAPLAFDASTMEFWAPLLEGGRLVLMPPGVPSLESLGEVLQRQRVTTAWLTAGLFHVMARERPQDLAGLRQLLAGGDVLSPELVRNVLEHAPGIEVINGYGPTENTTFTSTHPMVSSTTVPAPVPVGRPVSQTGVWILHRDLSLQPSGVFGELAASGKGLGRGYHRRPALTAERFVPHPHGGAGERLYLTGDRARHRADGTLEFGGRLDHQVKIRGFRVEPGEVEAALTALPEVAAAVAMAREDGGEKRLVAYVVGRGESLPEASELRQGLSLELPPYLVPDAIVPLEAFPLTPNGKLDRAALPAPGFTGEKTFIAPRGPVEQVIAGIWQEVLGVERVGAEDGFFELGGHSLLATQVISRVRDALGTEVPLRALFESPTVSALAREVEEARRQSQGLHIPSLEPTAREGDLPLSFAQQRLWFIDQLEPGMPLYNMPFPTRLEGALEPQRLEYALSRVLERHEVLRTRYETEEGSPRQCVDAFVPLWLPRVDLSGLPEEQRLPEARRLADADAARPFDLAAGPILRATLVEMAGDDFLLLFNLHHIAGDGWSIEVLTREISAFYSAAGAASDEAPDLPELPVQYADFAAWQRGWLQGEVLDAEVAWWKERLAGAPSLLELPTDHPRPGAPSFRGDSRSLVVDSELGQALGELARQRGATLFMVLLAALYHLLSRHSGQRDVSVGTPVAGRDRLELEPLVGFFVNTLVLRVVLNGEPSFNQLIEAVREVSLEAQGHQAVPFEKLVEELVDDRDLSHAPLFQVMFTVQNLAQEMPELGEVRMSLLEAEGSTAKFDLSPIATELAEGELSLGMEYAVDLFDGTTVEQLLQRWAALLRGAAAEPDRPLASFDMLSSAERHQMALEWNDSAVAYPSERGLPSLFSEQVDARGDAIAVVLGDAQLSYAELDRRSHRVASVLVERGVRVDGKVGLFLERSLDMVIATLGILRAGAAYVPLDPEYPEERLRWMVEDGSLETVVTREELAERVETLSASPLVMASLGEASASVSLPNPSGDALAYVMYTSGSTGRPKGVAVPHRGIVRLVKGANYADLGPDQVFLQLAPVSFDLSTLELWGALLNGGRVALLPPGVPALPDLGAALWRHRVSILWLTAGLFHLMVDEQAEDLQALQQLLAGGDVLSPERVRRVLELPAAPVVIDGYGPTENTTFTSCYPMVDPDQVEASVSIGRPVSNSGVWILDDQLRPAPAGAFGELTSSGDGLARGYLGRPALTAERFVPHPLASRPGDRVYRTGDSARYLRDGRLEFAGRMDQQVKLRGFRIEPGEVEALLLEQVDVAAAFVMVREDGPASNRRLVAYLVGRDGIEPDRSAARALLEERLPSYMVPSAFVALDALPLSPNGKVDRKALPAPEGGGEAEHVAPRTEVEGVIAGLWTQLLGVERVGVEDNFFVLGGHSLLATQMISRLRKALGVEVPLRELFEAPTVAGLARAAEEARRLASGLATPPLEAVARDEALPLSFAQQRLWFIDRLEPGLSIYNMPFPVRLRGPLDGARLEAALSEVMRRHEVLRTSFQLDGEKPYQVIAAPASFHLPRIDLDALPEERREALAHHLVAEDAGRAFDLAQGPILRTALLRLGPEEHILLFNLHHIAGDGWSIEVLVQEVSELYGAASRGEAAQLPPLPIQYADFAVWQRGWLSGEVLEGEIEHWRQRLAGALPLDLPTDRPRPSVQSFRGATCMVPLPSEVGLALQDKAQASGSTLFMALLTGLAWTLSRVAVTDDVSVGTPVAGRTHLELEPLIGFFVNTLVLRIQTDGEDGTQAPTFEQLLAQVREVSLEAQAHQDVPFEKLVEELVADRTPGRSPLFQVMYSLQKVAEEPPELGEVKVELLQEEGGGTAKFDLSLAVTQNPNGGLALGAEYAVDLFDATTVQRFLDQLGSLLRGVVEEGERPLSAIPFTTQAQRHQVEVEWNDTAVAYPEESSLATLFAEVVAERGEAVALAEVGETSLQLSFGELARRAAVVTAALEGRNLAPDGLVGIFLERSANMVIATLGILGAGQGFVPLDPSYPRERLRFLIEDSSLEVLITTETLEGELPESSATVLRIESLGESAAPKGSAPRGGDALAYVMYTSGSMGRPKGVAVPQRAVVRLVRGANFARLGPEQTFLQLAPFAFDASTLELWAPLLGGGRLVLPPSGVPALDELGDLLRRQRISTLWLTAGLFHLMVDERPEDLAGLDQLLAGGDVLSVERVRRVLDVEGGPRMINGYGPTENTTFTACFGMESTSQVGSTVSIGRPLSNTEVWIVDRQLCPVPTGVFGELVTSGAGLARGYLGRPSLTAQSFTPHPLPRRAGERIYRTGDLARHLGDGSIEFAGRRDQQVKLRGFRIEPGEIEAALMRQKGVSGAFVTVHSGSAGDRLVAYLVGGELELPSAEVLRKALRDELPIYMVPASFVPLEALPLNPNGKVDRDALPEPPEDDGEHGFLAPRDDTERTLATIWQDLLGVESIGVHDDFFERGGHSLLGIQLLSRIKKALGQEIPIAALFRTPTIAGLAAVLRGEGAGGLYDSLVPFDTKGERPPVFYIHPGGGMVFFYRDLVERIDVGTPAYGLQSQGLEGGVAPFDSLEFMASHYLEEIRGVQSEGPYHLVGWSMGGVIAFEMSRQLRAAGEEVAFLGLIDSHVPNRFDRIGEREPLVLLERFAQNFGLPLDIQMPIDEFLALELREQLDYVLEQAREAGDLPEDLDLDRVMRYFRIFKLNAHALATYEPGPYHGKIHLFRASEPHQSLLRNPDASWFDHLVLIVSFWLRWLEVKLWNRFINKGLGWQKIEGCEVQGERVPGDHYSLLLEPNVETLATRLKVAFEALWTDDDPKNSP